MDNQEIINQNSKLGRILTRRNIVIFFIIIIILEVVWGAWLFLKPEQFGFKGSEANPKTNNIELTSAQKSIKVGEKLTVGIGLSTTEHTEGADVIISFDPKLFSVELFDGKPVKVGTIYDDYPQNVLDEKVGTITFSGVTNQPYGIDTNGFVGSVNFVAKAPGLAKIIVQHTPGSTADSNLTSTKTGQDLLQNVYNLDITIVQ